jgi:hypothetical protein
VRVADKTCFVIAPIGLPDSETRKRSDVVLKYVIRPAVGECGYQAIRADEMAEPGLITSQVIQRIVDDPLVVADLTESNPNVFYELAIRHTLRKPLVQLIAKGERIPFDVAGMRTITVDHKDLESVEEAKKGIVAQIKAMERPGEVIETPITMSLDLQRLRQSNKPEDRSLADIILAISDVKSSIAHIDRRLETSLARYRTIDELAADLGAIDHSMRMRVESFLSAMPSPELDFVKTHGVANAHRKAFKTYLRDLGALERNTQNTTAVTNDEAKGRP